MKDSNSIASELIRRLEARKFAQVDGYNKFGFVKKTSTYVVVSREAGQDTKIPGAKLAEAVEAVRCDHNVYSGGPSKLQKKGLTYISSPLWSILHLMTLAELIE